MLDLSAERAVGAHTYLVTPEHTAKARAQLGAPWLVVEQAVVLETDPAAARAIGRRHVARYLDLPNYTNNFRRLGFTTEDIANRGSDRLVDGLVGGGLGADALEFGVEGIGGVLSGVGQAPGGGGQPAARTGVLAAPLRDSCWLAMVFRDPSRLRTLWRWQGSSQLCSPAASRLGRQCRARPLGDPVR
jgi:hypothetical protein